MNTFTCGATLETIPKQKSEINITRIAGMASLMDRFNNVAPRPISVVIKLGDARLITAGAGIILKL